MRWPFVMTASFGLALWGHACSGSGDDEGDGSGDPQDTDGANEDDTLALWAAEIPEVSTSEERATYQLNVSALDHVKVKITNNDSADTIDVFVSAMAGYA